MTSPARCTRTVSPTRTSLLATSSSLWRVARLTVTPPTSTGAITAMGVTAPVRPTLTSMANTRVVASGGGELIGQGPAGAPGFGAQALL